MSYTRLNPASASATSGLFEPASGISTETEKATSYGKVVMLELYIKHSSAWTVGTQYNIGTVADSYKPIQSIYGMAGSYGGALLLDTGAVYIRPLYATELAANSTTYVRFVYLVP